MTRASTRDKLCSRNVGPSSIVHIDEQGIVPGLHARFKYSTGQLGRVVWPWIGHVRSRMGGCLMPNGRVEKGWVLDALPARTRPVSPAVSQATGFWSSPGCAGKRVPDCSDWGGYSLIRRGSPTGNHGQDAPPKGVCHEGSFLEANHETCE